MIERSTVFCDYNVLMAGFRSIDRASLMPLKKVLRLRADLCVMGRLFEFACIAGTDGPPTFLP